jgi:hypothetical protein
MHSSPQVVSIGSDRRAPKQANANSNCFDFSRILALDLSWSDTGWAAKDHLSSDVQYGSLSELPGSDEERLDKIVYEVMRRINGTTLVAMEDFAVAKGRRAHQPGGLGYLVRYSLYQHPVPFLVINPKQRTKFPCGGGNGKKEHLLRDVLARYGVSIDNNNAADAFAMNHVVQCVMGWELPKQACQHEVIATIKESYRTGPKSKVSKVSSYCWCFARAFQESWYHRMVDGPEREETLLGFLGHSVTTSLNGRHDPLGSSTGIVRRQPYWFFCLLPFAPRGSCAAESCSRMHP